MDRLVRRKLPHPHINAQCDKISLYARSVSTLRDIGMPLSDIDARSARLTDMPYLAINADAYNLKTKNPSDAYIVFYQMCQSVGYDLMIETFEKEEYARSGVEPRKTVPTLIMSTSLTFPKHHKKHTVKQH